MSKFHNIRFDDEMYAELKKESVETEVPFNAIVLRHIRDSMKQQKLAIARLNSPKIGYSKEELEIKMNKFFDN